MEKINKNKKNKKNITLEPIAQNFINKVNLDMTKPIYELSNSDSKEFLENVQKKYATKIIKAKIKDIILPITFAKKLSIRIVKPFSNKTSILPIVLYVHGGGWRLGSHRTHDRIIRKIANDANVCVVFVNYSLSPRARYPVAIEQVYATLEYIKEYGKKMHLDSSRIAIVGDSAGGNIATVVTMLTKKRKGPYISLQILLYPIIDASFNYESYVTFKNGPWITKSEMEWAWDAYEPNIKMRKNPALSPINASLKALSKLPETLIITAENDILRDEGEAYAHKLARAGVNVTAMRYVNAMHGFVVLNALENTFSAKNATDTIILHLKKVLFKK